MISKYWFAVAAFAATPIATLAQQKASVADPTWAEAPVAAVTYESAFQGYRPMAEPEAAADVIWKSANQQVDPSSGHAGHASDADTPTPSAFGNAPTGHDAHQKKDN
jgi:hypothetical protein